MPHATRVAITYTRANIQASNSKQAFEVKTCRRVFMDNIVFNEKNAITMELERREGVGKGGGVELKTVMAFAKSRFSTLYQCSTQNIRR